LRHHDAECSLADDRIAVPELRRVFHLHRNARKFLEHQLADQRRVPAGSARRDDDVVDVEELLVREVQAAELGRAVLQDQAAAHRVLDGVRLLENLLEHEVRVSAALDLRQIPVDAVDEARLRRGVKVDHAITVPLDHRHVAFVEVHHLPGVGEDCRCIRREEVLAIADTDEQRAALAGRDDLARIAAAHHCNAVGARNLAQRVNHSLFEGAVVKLLDEVREHLRVGVRTELVAELPERGTQGACVLDDTVVDHRNRAVGAQVRMRIPFRRRSVRGPARVPDAGHAVHGVGGNRTFELRDLARSPARLDCLAVKQGDAGGVVPAVLHSLEPLDQQRGGLLGADVSNDAAH
jgi:hypothetical protein